MIFHPRPEANYSVNLNLMQILSPMRTTGGELNADGWRLHCGEKQSTRPPIVLLLVI